MLHEPDHLSHCIIQSQIIPDKAHPEPVLRTRSANLKLAMVAAAVLPTLVGWKTHSQ